MKYSNNYRKTTLGIIAYLLVFNCGYVGAQSGRTTNNKPLFGKWGVETQFISSKILPGDDFYRYVNEGWLTTKTIPAGASGLSNYSEAKKVVNERISDLITKEANENISSRPLQQVRDLYHGYVDTSKIEIMGVSRIEQEVRRILSIRSYEDIAAWMADPKSFSIVSVHTEPDINNRSRFLVTLSESGIGLPSPLFYQKKDGAYPGYREAYKEYIMHVLKLIGITDAERRANDIIEIETKLASLQWTPAQMRDSKTNSHLMATTELDSYAPGFPWKAFLEERQVANVKEVVLQADLAIKAKAALFAVTPVEVWASYLAFHWIVNHSTVLPSKFRKSQFDFYSRTLNGISKDIPREQKAVLYVNSRIGQLVGKLYVERYFSNEYKKSTQKMVEYVHKAFKSRLEKLDWLDESSRSEAIAKLNAVTFRIGYPDTWRDYSTIRFNEEDPIANERIIARVNWDYERSLLGRVYTSKEWYQVPQTVDATSSKLYNSIEFPAGILQPPFFDPYADVAVNFGAIGAIIGHELGHCFDDEGSRFDGNGKLRDWWTANTRASFQVRTAKLIDQYNSFSPLDGLYVDGKQTLGENIGDLTGAIVAYDAYLDKPLQIDPSSPL
ncbi:M13 family peptidase [Pedobacter petrophilus]|uniref:M13 family peptidase n=1 Tax=Pedobacter petrophilus TaxID=1908241 RepID=A0A7K0FXZ4_9SPHI|nr:M13 family metallopeptidase [Pedobacter petrophilus]MRX75819.1 M13 family peptidase [Pedobacter petrophilus]